MIENPFKNIIEHRQVPEILKERVMNDIRLIKLSMDMADLVAVKYPSSIFNLLNTATKKKKDDNRNSDKN
ncbi:MAG: hypothetical protein WCY16_02750 [Weeksellaceae bacterium]